MKHLKSILVPAGLFVICITLLAAYRSAAQSGDGKDTESANSQLINLDRGQKALPGKELVIGYLHTRDRVVTISKGSDGTVYTVKNKEGKTLAANLSQKDFAAKYPALYEQVEYGVAGNDATLHRTAMPASASR